MAAISGPSISNIEDHHHRISLANLTKLINVELDLLMESFQEAKRKIDPMISQINEARNKFNELLEQGGGGEMMMEMERELRDLKQTTSKLKLKIPFNLIAPEYQPSADPNVILQPRTHPCNLLVDDDALLGDKSDDLIYFSYIVNNHPYAYESIVLRCFLAFPEGAFIKASLLYSYAEAAEAVSSLFTTPFKVSTVRKFITKGFIKPAYKKHSSTTVEGFWMDTFVHRTLKDSLSCEFLQLRYLVNSSSIDGEDIIYSGSADRLTLSSDLQFIHLGKWQRYHTHYNIGMPDPDLYFTHISSLSFLAYISFRGVSVMKELPCFITRLWDPYISSDALLRSLRILDLKACHHLEVIPSNIGNLWCSLTHLDMSECYFLDHMPVSLSHLICLRVLKGFFVGETSNNEEETCTLQDLSSMHYLVKLHIYTSLKTFPSDNHLTILQRFGVLRNLTICWGGCPTREENREFGRPPRISSAIRLKRLVTHSPDHPVVAVDKKFSFSLEKLDLRGAPEMGTHDWLKPSNFEKLEKLYIRGGQLSHLRHNDEAQKDEQSAAVKEKGWSVKILRLRHLSKLKMDWSEVQDSFPNVVSLEKVDCPNLTSFPCDDDGLWTKDTTHTLADGLEEIHGISNCQRGPVECEDTAVEVLEQTAEGSGMSFFLNWLAWRR